MIGVNKGSKILSTHPEIEKLNQIEELKRAEMNCNKKSTKQKKRKRKKQSMTQGNLDEELLVKSKPFERISVGSFNDQENSFSMSQNLKQDLSEKLKLPKRQSSTNVEMLSVYQNIKFESFKEVLKIKQLCLYINIFFISSLMSLDFNNFQVFIYSNINPTSQEYCTDKSTLIEKTGFYLICPNNPVFLVIGAISAFFLIFIFPICLTVSNQLKVMKVLSWMLLPLFVVQILPNITIPKLVNIYLQILLLSLRCIGSVGLYAIMLLFINKKVDLGIRGRLYAVSLSVTGLTYTLLPLLIGILVE